MSATDHLQAKCFGCGFVSNAGEEAWDAVEHPPLGTVMRCPECGSTDVHTQR